MIEGRLIDYDGCCLSYLYASGRTYGVRHGRIMILPVLVLGAHAAGRRLIAPVLSLLGRYAITKI